MLSSVKCAISKIQKIDINAGKKILKTGFELDNPCKMLPGSNRYRKK